VDEKRWQEMKSQRCDEVEQRTGWVVVRTLE